MFSDTVKKILFKIWLILVCGIPRKEGNYAVYWGVKEKEYWVFQISLLRSLLVDRVEKYGHWASHFLNDLLEKYHGKNKNSD